MIIVTVELLSARTRKTTLLGSMVLENISGAGRLRDYRARTFRKGKRPITALADNLRPVREGTVHDHPSDAVSVWVLVAKALKNMGLSS